MIPVSRVVVVKHSSVTKQANVQTNTCVITPSRPAKPKVDDGAVFDYLYFNTLVFGKKFFFVVDGVPTMGPWIRQSNVKVDHLFVLA